jgi:hypothetical protein
MRPSDALLGGPLTTTEVASLCGVDPLLLGAGHSPSATAWLRSVLELVAGRLGYDARLRELLESSDDASALLLAASAEERGSSLRAETVEGVDAAWGRLTKAGGDSRTAAIGLLRSPEVGRGGFTELASESVAELEKFTLTRERPRRVQLVEAALAALRRIDEAHRDAIAIVRESEREAQERLAHMRARAGQAASGLVELLFSDQPARAARARDALRALPDLVAERRADAIELLAAGQLDEVLLLPEARGRTPTPLLPPPARAPGASTAIALSVVSQNLLQSAVANTTATLSTEEARRLLSDIEALPPAKRDAPLLAQARQTPPGSIHYALLGAGLLAAGHRFAFDVGNARFARQCFTDAVACLARADGLRDDRQCNEAIGLLVLTRAWALVGDKLGPSTLHDIRRDPSAFIAWLEQHEALHAIAEAFVDERWEVAEELLAWARMFMPDEERLVRVAVERLLRPGSLYDRPEEALSRLGALLRMDAAPKLRDLLDRLGQELASPDRTKPTARNAILGILEEIAAELQRVDAASSTIVEVLGERLPDIVRTFVQAPPRTERPTFAFPDSVDQIFVADRKRDLRFPFVVAVGEAGGAARDLHARVMLDTDDATHVRLLEPTEQPLPPLEPGTQHELSFFFDWTSKELDRAAVGFKVELKSGLEVVASRSRRVTVRLEPRRGRNPPYQPGVALLGDEGFVGRERHLKIVTDSLLADRVRVPLVVGVRRVGKTSILHALSRDPRISGRFAAMYVTLEGRPLSETSVTLLEYLASRLSELIRGELGPDRAKAPTPVHAEFAIDPYAAFERFAGAVEKLGLKRRLLLIIDEFDKLVEIVRVSRVRQEAALGTLGPNDILQPEVLGALRGMVMSRRAIRLVVAGLPRLKNLGYEERFFGMLEPVQVQGFSEEEATKVIAAGEPTMRLTADARSEVLRASGGQPYILQLVCQALFAIMIEEGRNLATVADVREAIEEHILTNRGYFSDFLNLVDDESRPVVLALAALHRELHWRQYVSLSELARALRPQGLAGAELEARLAALETEERPLIERAPNDRSRFRLTIGALGDLLLRRS